MKAILFDLDGTLFDRDMTVRRNVEAQYDDFAEALLGVTREHFVDRFIDLDHHGLSDKKIVYRELASEFGLQARIAAEMFKDFWRRYHEDCIPYQGLYEMLKELKARGFKLGIVTNGQDHIQDGTIDALNIRSYFDVIVISESAGVRKPDSRIFHMATDAVNVKPEEAVFVGDNPTADISGAISAGMSAIWRPQSYWDPPKQDVPAIDSLHHILDLV